MALHQQKRSQESHFGIGPWHDWRRGIPRTEELCPEVLWTIWGKKPTCVSFNHKKGISDAVFVSLSQRKCVWKDLDYISNKDFGNKVCKIADISGATNIIMGRKGEVQTDIKRYHEPKFSWTH